MRSLKNTVFQGAFEEFMALPQPSAAHCQIVSSDALQSTGHVGQLEECFPGNATLLCTNKSNNNMSIKVILFQMVAFLL